MLDECQFLVLAMWDLKSMMFEVVIKGWMTIISFTLFTWSPSHIELPVAGHFLSLPHLPITSGWEPYSVCMLWLDMSWVLDLTYIFGPHISLFILIFSTLTSSHYFFRHPISPLVIFVLCFFSHHCLLDTILVSPRVVVFHTSLHGGLSHSFLPFTPWVVVKRSQFERLSC